MVVARECACAFCHKVPTDPRYISTCTPPNKRHEVAKIGVIHYDWRMNRGSRLFAPLFKVGLQLATQERAAAVSTVVYGESEEEKGCVVSDFFFAGLSVCLLGRRKRIKSLKRVIDWFPTQRRDTQHSHNVHNEQDKSKLINMLDMQEPTQECPVMRGCANLKKKRRQTKQKRDKNREPKQRHRNLGKYNIKLVLLTWKC